MGYKKVKMQRNREFLTFIRMEDRYVFIVFDKEDRG